LARDTWYRLDNVGKFYSSEAGSSFQTVFRFSATFVDDVDELALQHATEKAVSFFPNFNVCLRNGMFWHYLESASRPPTISHENLPICFGLHVDTKSVLFRVSYYQRRVNLEVSHMVSDGRGTMSFFKALLSSYAQERYGIEGPFLDYDGSDFQKSEDSFDKYYERGKRALEPEGPEELSPVQKGKVYRLSGWRDAADPTYLEYHLPSEEVLSLARSYGVSVTSLICAAIICAIRAEMPFRARQRTIRISIPVDLRQAFGSTTTNNFFGLTFVSYTPTSDEPVEKVAAQIHSQLAHVAQAKQLKPRMNRMISLEKSPFLRYAPLFIKDLVILWASRIAARDATLTVSNLGQIRVDERLAPFLTDINILISTTGLNLSICSLGGDLSIGISTIFSNLGVVKHFCRFFSSQGIKGHINSNKAHADGAAGRSEHRHEPPSERPGSKADGHDKDDAKGVAKGAATGDATGDAVIEREGQQ